MVQTYLCRRWLSLREEGKLEETERLVLKDFAGEMKIPVCLRP
jgi:hypothetical protein